MSWTLLICRLQFVLDKQKFPEEDVDEVSLSSSNVQNNVDAVDGNDNFSTSISINALAMISN